MSKKIQRNDNLEKGNGGKRISEKYWEKVGSGSIYSTTLQGRNQCLTSSKLLHVSPNLLFPLWGHAPKFSFALVWLFYQPFFRLLASSANFFMKSPSQSRLPPETRLAVLDQPRDFGLGSSDLGDSHGMSQRPWRMGRKVLDLSNTSGMTGDNTGRWIALAPHHHTGWHTTFLSSKWLTFSSW